MKTFRLKLGFLAECCPDFGRRAILIRDERLILELGQAASRIVEVKTTADVLKALQGQLARFGFSDVLITGLPVRQDQHWQRAIVCDGWRQEWYRRYLAEGHFQHDPCVARCRHRAFPFLWSDLQPEFMSPRAKLVMDEARDFAMKDGLCVPIHIPYHGPVAVSAAGERIELSPSERPLVEVLCLKAFQTICRLEGRLEPERGPTLGQREAEVLQWNAQGKTAGETAIILNVSKFTVQAHLRHIREKLGANNVSRAVTKAMALGEIQAGTDEIGDSDRRTGRGLP